MLPLILLVGAGLATSIGGMIYASNESRKRLNQRIMNAGGLSKVNAVTLISSNYKGKVKTSGKGIPINSDGDDWETCEFELKLAAARVNCNIVTNVRKEGNRRDGFRFSGIAYRKG